MIELAPPDIGIYCKADKKNQIKNIKNIVKDCITDVPQVDLLRVIVKIKKFSTVEKILCHINNQNKFAKKLYIILHITIGYDNIVPITAKMIQEKTIAVLKFMTDYENINVNIYIKK